MRVVKQLVRRVLGEQATGAIDYFRFSRHPAEFDGPFNNQPVRQEIFRTLVARIPPSAIVETGTFKGTTTAFMADMGVPVYTAEANRRFFGFARIRLRGRRNVTLVCRDSRAALQSWLDGELRSLAGGTILFYLDAHWHDDLPLAEELVIVFERCRNAIVMIDDFRVPYDEGYGYDVYGPGKALERAYIQKVVETFGLCTLYPSTPAASEGGARRGTVVLARVGVQSDALASLPLLRLA